MQVTVYSLPGSVCHGCRFTKRKLEDLAIDYDEVRLDQNAEALERIKREVLEDPNGRLKMPVVRVDLGGGATWTWQGYAPSQIERLKREITVTRKVA